MTNRVLPSAEEVPALVPARGSIVWRYAGDARLLATAGYALLLQVAHPTVGAGVTEHSDFKADPWGRLFRTLDYTYAMVYGGPRLAGEIGARVREMHKRIKGTKPDGERYHALEPEAYAWVHATLCEAIITGHRHFGLRMRPDEIERFWADWRRSGRVVGVRERDLPDDWTGFRSYFNYMVERRLEDNEAVQDVIATLARPTRPPVPILNDAAWRVASLPMTRIFSLATVGLLPSLLRQRFGARWTRAQELELRALGAAARATTPLLPRSLRNTGPPYLRRRREALARGDVASLSGGPRSLASAA
ncbi:MAG: hypothetical protein QOK04_284 [Solirubrobacteraceae bacterium]|nr:hypothetical protein [Solirubrobacteraceae bacterium]